MTVLETAPIEPIIYQNLQGSIPTDIGVGTFISLNREPPSKIYSLGFQPAKSIPEISRWFLQKYARQPFNILEPFAGSGTTLLETMRFGSRISWLDYQPLSRLICQVKTTSFSRDSILQAMHRIIQHSFNQTHAPTTISFANKDFWFQPSVQEGLEILRHYILEAELAVQPVFWLAFATTVRKTSNMNDGMILAARRPNVADIPQRSRLDVFNYFQFYVEKVVEAITDWKPVLLHSPAAVELSSHDARCLPGDMNYDAVITSPPYINAIDYVWASKFELHWLGLVSDDESRLSLYAQEIGTERIPTNEVRELGRTGHFQLDRLIEDIYFGRCYQATKGQNALRARVTYKYFNDMKTHFAASFARLSPGGYYCFSIGDVSKICGVDIPVATILTDLACEVGFRKNFHFDLLLKNRRLNIPRNVKWAGVIKHDTVVVLEKPR